MRVKLLSHTENPELAIATAAKLCYSDSDIDGIMKNLTNEEVERFTKMLASLKHLSPFEHASYTFAIEGVSRSLTHQLVRHRIASYSQQSQRYVAMDNVEFIKPDLIAEDEAASQEFDMAMSLIKDSYTSIKYILIDSMAIKFLKESSLPIPKCTHNDLIKWFKEQYPKEYSKFEKIANENARAVLPNSCETKIIVTMNVRTLFNFFHHRCCNRAQEEIRELARIMLAKVREASPSLFKNAGPACVSRICPEGAMQCEQLKGKIPTKKDVNKLINDYYKTMELR